MLQRVGIMWTTNALEPAAEHFISNLIRQKLFTVIDSLPAGKPDAEPWLLFLPENEFHEIGLLFASYLIRSSGHKVVYLGANVPLESLQMAAKVTPPARLLLFLAHNDLAEETEHYLSQLVAAFAGREICIAADRSLFEDIKVPANVRWLNSAEALEQLLKT